MLTFSIWNIYIYTFCKYWLKFENPAHLVKLPGQYIMDTHKWI